MRQTTYDWGNHNILDDIDYNEEDAKQFKALLDNKGEEEESVTALLLFKAVVAPNERVPAIIYTSPMLSHSSGVSELL